MFGKYCALLNDIALQHHLTSSERFDCRKRWGKKKINDKLEL